MFLLPTSTKNTALFSSKLYLVLLPTPAKNTALISSKLYPRSTIHSAHPNMSTLLTYPNKIAHIHSIFHRPFRTQIFYLYPFDGLKPIAGIPSSFQDSNMYRYQNSRKSGPGLLPIQRTWHEFTLSPKTQTSKIFPLTI